MAYTTINKSSLHFDSKLWDGTGSAQSITGLEFQPDWVWVKNRSRNSYHTLVDAVRGSSNVLASNATNAQNSDAQQVSSFNSDGFSVGTSTNTNASGETLVGWNWKANGAGSSNTDGSITTTVSANTTAGFSIVKWTAGSGVSGIGHGLGVIPKLIICKDLSVSSAWTVGSDLLNDWGGYLGLQSTNALNSETRMYKPSGYSSPTASLFYQDHSAFGSAGENMIAYCFAEKQGYSKFGTYTGNGNADGAFVYTGFKPAFILIRSVSTTNWNMFDNKRSAFNVADETFWSNTTGSESSIGTSYGIDILSNGFKAKTVSSQVNNNNTVHIFMAFAEAPLVGSNNVPATAR